MLQSERNLDEAVWDRFRRIRVVPNAGDMADTPDEVRVMAHIGEAVADDGDDSNVRLEQDLGFHVLGITTANLRVLEGAIHAVVRQTFCGYSCQAAFTLFKNNRGGHGLLRGTQLLPMMRLSGLEALRSLRRYIATHAEAASGAEVFAQEELGIFNPKSDEEILGPVDKAQGESDETLLWFFALPSEQTFEPLPDLQGSEAITSCLYRLG